MKPTNIWKAGIVLSIVLMLFAPNIIAHETFSMELTAEYGFLPPDMEIAERLEEDEDEDGDDDGGLAGALGLGAFAVIRGQYWWSFDPLPKRHGNAVLCTLYILPSYPYRKFDIDVIGRIKEVGDDTIYTDTHHEIIETAHLDNVFWVKWRMSGYPAEWIDWVDLEVTINVYDEGGSLLRTIHKYKKVNGNNGGTGGGSLGMPPSEMGTAQQLIALDEIVG